MQSSATKKWNNASRFTPLKFYSVINIRVITFDIYIEYVRHFAEWVESTFNNI